MRRRTPHSARVRPAAPHSRSEHGIVITSTRTITSMLRKFHPILLKNIQDKVDTI
jgi:hypothetical protein